MKFAMLPVGNRLIMGPSWKDDVPKARELVSVDDGNPRNLPVVGGLVCTSFPVPSPRSSVLVLGTECKCEYKC